MLLIAIAASAGVCRSQKSATDASAILRIGFGIGPTARAGGVHNLAELLYAEPLIGRAVNGRPMPHLADSWSWHDSDTKLVATLKPGVRFHDGSILTAELASRALTQQIDRARSHSKDAFSRVVSVGAEGMNVVVRLSQPDAFLLSELMALRITHPDARDVGTGPFRLLNRKPHVETVRFGAYHAGASSLGGVRIITFDTPRSAWAALLRGEVDAVQEVNRDSVEFLEGSGGVRTFSFLQPFYIPLVFNVGHPALRHVVVRRALNEAIDRAGIVERAMKGHGMVADGPIWPLHWAFVAPRATIPFNPASAAAQLDRAGFLTRPGSGDQPPARFSFTCLFWSEDPLYERIALSIQRQLFEVGVHVELEPATLMDLVKRAASGQFDAFLMRTNASRALDLTYGFWRSPQPNAEAMQRSGYTGADALLDALRQSTSDTAVHAAIDALSKRFVEDAPAVFIAWTEITRAVDARFVVPDVGTEDPFANISQWRLTTR